MLVLLLVGCGEKKEKVIDLNKRIPKSSKDYDKPDTNAVLDENEKALQHYKELLPELSAISPITERSFVERFHPDATEKWAFHLEEGDSVSYMRWKFNDSTRCKSAFYNWLDDEDVSYFGAKEPIQRDAFTMLYSDTLILMISGDVDAKFWRNWLEEREWIGDGDYLLEQRKYGKTRWFQRQDDEIIELKDE